MRAPTWRSTGCDLAKAVTKSFVAPGSLPPKRQPIVSRAVCTCKPAKVAVLVNASRDLLLASISARHHQTARVGTRCQGRCGSRPSLAGVQRADKPRARQRPRERSCGRANSLLVPMHGSFGLGRSHGVRWPGLCPPRGRCGSLGFFPRPAGQRAGRLRMLQRSRRCQARWQHAIGYWSWLAAPALRCRANVGPKCEVAAQATAGRFPAADRSVVTLVYSASMSRPGVEMQPARARESPG